MPDVELEKIEHIAARVLRNGPVYGPTTITLAEATQDLIARIRELERATNERGTAYLNGWNDARRLSAEPQSAVPKGWKLVPETPTDEMLAAMLSEGEYGVLAQHSFDPIGASAVLRISGVGTRYANMLASAPSPAKEG